MAPLYKRYVPTKVAAPIPDSRPVADGASAHFQENGQQSRKRVRTDEEIAQRKAKKLKQKITEANTIEQHAIVNSEKSYSPAATENVLTEESTIQPAHGEFAHIKNTKKRHKLEKEARKARKDAQKIELNSGTENQPTEDLAASDSFPKGQRPGTNNESSGPKLKSRHKEAQNGSLDRHISHETALDNGQPVALSDTSTPKPNSVRSETPHEQMDVPLASAGHPGTLTGDRLSKRRHKLESVLQPDPASQRTVGEGGHLQKHSGILGKFQKSSQIGRIISSKTVVPKEQPFTAPKIQDLVIPETEDPDAESLDAEAVLPRWLAKPTIISNDRKSTFESLGLPAGTTEHLTKLGFNDALPVQHALIPLLLSPSERGSAYLPGSDSVASDVAVSAPTGSGKTIAYLVPIFESLKAKVASGRLSALVVVPTRELVVQVAAVSESLAKGTSIKVGTATGAGSFRDETNKLIRRVRRYDPKGYDTLLNIAHRRNYDALQPNPHTLCVSDRADDGGGFETQESIDAVDELIDHVSVYESAVDILIATPGRLLDHIAKSLGFSLKHLRWLVLDEADKLLDEQYDGLLPTINDQISRPRNLQEQDFRQRYLRAAGNRDGDDDCRVRKVLLSATMTRDISKLMELKLNRPRLVVIRGAHESGPITYPMARERARTDANETFELPPTINEYSIHTGDGADKPLILIELLRTKIMGERNVVDDSQSESSPDSESLESDSEDESEPTSDAESDVSSTSESSIEDESEHEDRTTRTDADERPSRATQSSIHPERAAILARLEAGEAMNTAATVLIFTSSTESANRLSYLLKLLQPDLAPHITAMTRTSSKGNLLNAGTKPTDPVITISTDRAGRGLDSIGTRTITHVIQYDVPRSATSYVHRVGRTARVGRHGEAWTLFTHSEARWFMNTIVRSTHIKRSAAVEKIKIEVGDGELKQNLADALAAMRDQVFGRPKQR